jgi:predicted HTH domain antitoxin
VSIERRRKNVEVTISKELIPYLYTIQAVETVQDKVTLSVAIELFVSGTITLEKAAELAEKSIWDFMDLLKVCNISWRSIQKRNCRWMS